MKYSIRGQNFPTEIKKDILIILNKYFLWKLESLTSTGSLYFEAWLDSSEQKDLLYGELKHIVDSNADSSIDWHECTHDEIENKPCVIADIYGGE